MKKSRRSLGASPLNGADLGPRKAILVSNIDIQRMIYRVLQYRSDCQGRALTADIPSLCLKKHDRLLPFLGLLDVGSFEAKNVPFVVHFWRMTKRDRVKHNCPLLTLGIPGLVYDSWAIDGLHSWALGGLRVVIAHGLHFCMKSPVFKPACVHLETTDLEKLAMSHIKTLQMAYYRQKKQDPQWKKTGTEVRGLTSYAYWT